MIYQELFYCAECLHRCDLQRKVPEIFDDQAHHKKTRAIMQQIIIPLQTVSMGYRRLLTKSFHHIASMGKGRLLTKRYC